MIRGVLVNRSLVHTLGRPCYPNTTQVGYMWDGVQRKTSSCSFDTEITKSCLDENETIVYFLACIAGGLVRRR